MGAAHLVGIAAQGVLHGQGGITGAYGVVFVGQRCPKQRHNAVAQHLVHRALVAVHGLHHGVQGRVQDGPGLFRVEVADQLRRALEVGKQHRDLLALPFKRGLGGEDFFGEIRGCIGEGFTRGLRCEWRGSASASRPHEHGARLVHRDLMHLNEFRLERFQGMVIQVELQPERPIGQPVLGCGAGRSPDRAPHRSPSPPLHLHQRRLGLGQPEGHAMARYNSMAVDSSARACSR